MCLCGILSRHIGLHASFICTEIIVVFYNASINSSQQIVHSRSDRHNAHVAMTHRMTTVYQLCIVFIVGTDSVILNDAVS